MGHTLNQKAFEAAKAMANSQWEKYGSQSAEELIARRDEIISEQTRAMLDSHAAQMKKSEHFPMLEIKRRAAMHTRSILGMGESFHTASHEAFDNIINPQRAVDGDQAIAKLIEEAGYDHEYRSQPSRKPLDTTEVGYDGLWVLQGQLSEIFNPLRDPEQAGTATSIAREIAGQFVSKVATAKVAFTQIKNPQERQVAEKKAYLKAFEAMVAELPPNFVNGVLNHQLEADAEEKGFAVRMKPKNVVGQKELDNRVHSNDKLRKI